MDKRTERKVLLPVKAQATPDVSRGYGLLLSEISGILDQARRTSARTINSILTAAYWEIGRRIVQFEQKGQERAPYGERLLARLSVDLKKKHGRGFSERNLEQMRFFYLGWEISQTPSAKLAARVKQPVEDLPDTGWHISKSGPRRNNPASISLLTNPLSRIIL